MNDLSRYQGVRVHEMIHVLRKLGYRQVKQVKDRMRFFRKNGSDSLNTPFDQDEKMFPKVVWHMLNLLRLPDEDFDRLRKEP